MSTATLSQTITTPQLTAARLLIQLAHPDDASLTRALDKAAARVLSLAWRLDGPVLQIASFSHADVCYTCDGTTCTCKTTRGVCWHIAAHKLLATLRAAGVDVASACALPVDDERDDLPDSFLDTIDDLAFDELGMLRSAPARRGAVYRGEYHSETQLAQYAAARATLTQVEVEQQQRRYARAQAQADELFS